MSGLVVVAGVSFLSSLILAENAVTPFCQCNLWNALALINCMSGFEVMAVGSGLVVLKITLVSAQSIRGLCWTNQS